MSEKGKEIDISKIDLEREKIKMAENPGILPYAHHAGSAIVKSEDLGKAKGRAVTAMHQQTDIQMDQIYQQMQLLAEQARAIKDRVEISERVYLADIPFEPIINHIYYMYKRDDGTDVLSLIAPHEWNGKSKKYEIYVAKLKLLADHTWEVEKAKDADF
jgi:hypothetical protein